MTLSQQLLISILIIYTDRLIERANLQKVWSCELWRLLEAAKKIDHQDNEESASKFKELITDVNEEEDDDIVVMVIEVWTGAKSHKYKKNIKT